MPEADKNILLYTYRNNVARDWLYSVYVTNRKLENKKLVGDLIELLKSPMLEETVSSELFKNRECEELFYEMVQILEGQIRKNKERMVSCKEWSNEEFFLKKLIEHEYKILDDLKSLLTEEENDKERNLQISVLDSSWIQIHELIETLSMNAI